MTIWSTRNRRRNPEAFDLDNEIRKAFAGREDVEIHVYPGVDHAFARPGGHAWNKPAALTAHSRSIALFRRVMGPHFDL